MNAIILIQILIKCICNPHYNCRQVPGALRWYALIVSVVVYILMVLLLCEEAACQIFWRLGFFFLKVMNTGVWKRLHNINNEN